jgi:uncharacterized protein YegL
MKRRAPKGAAASIIVLFSAITLMMLTILGFVTGRLSTAKEEVSANTDAVLLTMAEAIKRKGPNAFCDDPAVRAMLAQYGGQCPQAELRVGANGIGAYHLEYQAREQNVEIPTGFFDHQNVEVSTTAVGEVVHRYLPAEERRPKFVLVLDYSGSMGLRFGNGTRTDALKDSVNMLLGRGYRIDYGAVIFDDSIVATVPIGQNNERAVAAQVNRFGPMGGTCYHGLATALGLLRQQQNSGYYVLFVTDGEPNDGCSDGSGESVQLWNNDVTIFSLFIGNNDNALNRLRNLSGTPQRRHNPGYAMNARNPAQLRESFDQIMGRIPCRAYPDFNQMADPSRVYVGIELAQREILTPAMLGWDEYHAFEANRPNEFDRNPYATVNLAPANNDPRYVLVNHTGCQPVIEQGAQLLLRYERPGLATAQ